ncbi:MAG TPA: glycosyltransferase [Candidatus Eisenbergiella stercoravium]|nr:glycosyltransferase [Candidatus Eisenbergiella stercoravium]
MNQEPLISIIVRTNNRPDILINALNSIRSQTYKNIEAVVIEDGKNMSEKMIRENFSDINLKYHATEKRVGRSAAGNLGMSMASGVYFNFLDDDDILFPEHIEKLYRCISQNGTKAAYSVAEERQIIITGREPYLYKVKRKLVRYRQPFSRLVLYYQNYIPIQTILFSREFYENMGGFDNNLDMFEDWDLWVRFSIYGDFAFCDDLTSAYFVLFKRNQKKQRAESFYDTKKLLFKKFKSYEIEISVGELREDLSNTLEEYFSGRLVRYLKMVWAFLLYGEK